MEMASQIKKQDESVRKRLKKGYITILAFWVVFLHY